MTVIELDLVGDVVISTNLNSSPVIELDVQSGGVGPPGPPGPAHPPVEIEPATDLTSQGPITSSINAGATISAIQCVRLNQNGTWLLANATTAVTAAGFLAISLEAKSNGEPMNVALSGSVIRNDAWNWTTPNAVLFLSTTSGNVTDIAPSGTDVAVRVVGYVLTDDCIWFEPSPDFITLN